MVAKNSTKKINCAFGVALPPSARFSAMVVRSINACSALSMTGLALAKADLTGEFVIGDMVYAPKTAPKKVLLADTVDVSLRADFTCKGTAEEWVDLVDRIYNRPSAEMYQFSICTKFATPLVRLMGSEGAWHGIPSALGGDTGEAKTTTSLVGLSMYAPPSVLCFNAGEKQGDTINALSLKLGSLRNLPCLMDEMTNSTAERISEVTFMLANGRSKDRMGTNGKMIPNPHRWDLLSDMSSNDSMHETLHNLKNEKTKEAGQLRCFELFFAKGSLNRIFKDVKRSVVKDELLKKHYGHGGRKWIQFVVDNRLAIERMLEMRRAAYQVDVNDSSEIRFYKDLIVVVHVAAELAYKRGFIKWDVKKMLKWAEDQLIVLRDQVAHKDWDSSISDFVASMHGRTIVTKSMKLGPGRRSKNLEMPIEQLTANATPVARKALDDKRFVFTASYLRDWASRNRIPPSSLLAEMIARRYLVGVVGDKVVPHMINIGSGTTVTRPQAPCYELDYDKVGYASDSEETDMTNVVQLPVVTNSVTEPPKEEGATLAAKPL